MDTVFGQLSAGFADSAIATANGDDAIFGFAFGFCDNGLRYIIRGAFMFREEAVYDFLIFFTNFSISSIFIMA